MTNASASDLDARISQLFRRNLHTIKLGLEPMEALTAALGRPQDAFLSIHVAGTNGKGSVCALIASMLRAAGFRVGLYTSPHLCHFRERLRVNGEAIPDVELPALIDTVEAAAARVRAGGERDATFFEFTTALAFEWFRRRNVQVAVLETGMGGRLDATNVVTPVVSVITSIGLDHQAYLGDTIEKIAGEKAGIIKAGRPVVCAPLPEDAMRVMIQTARSRKALLVPVEDACRVTRIRQTVEGQVVGIETADESIGRATCPLLGRHQLVNLATAVTSAFTFSAETKLPVPAGSIRKGIEAVDWPARAQVVERDPTLVIDGAHNPEAAAALRKTLDELRGDRPLGLVASFLADKDAVQCLRLLARGAARCWLVPLTGERALDAAGLRSAAQQAGVQAACHTLEEAIAQARDWARAKQGVVCFAGSLYLAGAALASLRRAPSDRN